MPTIIFVLRGGVRNIRLYLLIPIWLGGKGAGSKYLFIYMYSTCIIVNVLKV